MVTQAIETRAPARRLEKTPLSPSGVFFLALPVARMSGATCGEHWPGYRFAHPGCGDAAGAVLTCRAYLSSMIMRASAMRSTSIAPSVIIMLR